MLRSLGGGGGEENRLGSFHRRCLRRIMGITWQDKVTNVAVLEKAGSLSMHLKLCKYRLRWLGHVRRMEDGRIPKDLLYDELATGCRPIGQPALHFKDVCKRDLKLTGIDAESWEALALDRDGWRHAVSSGVKMGEEKRILKLKERRERRKAGEENAADTLHSEFVCVHCGRDCHARIGLLSHSRRCSQQSQ